MHLDTERDVRYYFFIGMLSRAIQTYRECGCTKEIQMVNMISGGKIIQREIAKWALDVRFRMVASSQHQIEDLIKEVPAIKEMFLEVKDQSRIEKSEDVFNSMSTWINDLAKDKGFNQSFSSTDYLSSTVLLNNFKTLT